MVTSNETVQQIRDEVIDIAGERMLAAAKGMRPCILCKEPTTGSVGAAGLRWPMICQPCKDKEDAAALSGSKAIARAAQTPVSVGIESTMAVAATGPTWTGNELGVTLPRRRPQPERHEITVTMDFDGIEIPVTVEYAFKDDYDGAGDKVIGRSAEALRIVPTPACPEGIAKQIDKDWDEITEALAALGDGRD